MLREPQPPYEPGSAVAPRSTFATQGLPHTLDGAILVKLLATIAVGFRVDGHAVQEV